MYEIVSGNIAAGVIYQIYGILTIEYNSIQYSDGDNFTGIDSITTYSIISSGTPSGIVTEASIYLGQTAEIENDFYLGLFNDDSSYLGQSAELGDPLLFEIVSGNIAPGVIYFVDGGTSIVYNSITVNTNEFFIGVDGIADYTKTSGDELVTESSTLLGISTEIENDFYLDHFTDDSKYLGQSTGIGDPWLFEIVSGNIAPGITYFVDGGTAIIYNSITVNTNEFFVGIDGITDYTKTDNTELVTEVTEFLGQSFGFENDYYLGLFNDDSTFKGLSFTVVDNPGRITTTVGNKGTFPTSGLIGEWLLNGTTYDSSKNNRNGTDLGVTYINNRHDVSTSAIETTSADILIQDWDLLPETNWAISFWQNSQSSNSNSSSFTIGDRDNTNKIINHRKFTTQYISFIDSVSGFIQYDTGVILEDDTWNHIIIMQTGSTFKYFVNNELRYSNTLNGVNLVSSNDISLGSFTDSDKRYWNGYIDDFRIYDRGLTTNEMWLLYNE